jgi:hypothetical protein
MRGGKIMMKRYFSILAFSFVAFTACVNDVHPENEGTSTDQFENPVEITFTASGGNLAKTVLNHNEVLWKTGDAIKVLWGDKKSVKSVAEVYNSHLNADFKATVEEAEAYYGVYPYDAVSSVTGSGAVTVTVPEVQSGLFEDNNIIVAKADVNNHMQFRHALSYLEFTIDKPGHLVFSCGNPVAGSVKVSFNEDETINHTAVEGGKKIMLDINNSGTYYIAMLPDVKLDNLNFQLTNAYGTKYINAQFNRVMSRGKILGIGNITDKFGEYSVGATLETLEIVEFDFGF